MKVGDKLWHVVNDRRYFNEYEVTVTKVGRVWAELNNDPKFRVNIESMYIDGRGYTSPGACYYSKENYEEEKNRGEAWKAFRKELEYIWSPQNHLSLAQIQGLIAVVKKI